MEGRPSVNDERAVERKLTEAMGDEGVVEEGVDQGILARLEPGMAWSSCQQRQRVLARTGAQVEKKTGSLWTHHSARTTSD